MNPIAGAAVSGELPTVLCIDDDPDVLAVTRACLEVNGEWNVITASSGGEALGIASDAQLSVIILDVMIPQMDGVATLKALRKISALDRVPIIFMTARAWRSEASGYLALGADSVLSKPFDPFTLSAQIRGIWRKFDEKQAL